MKCSHGNIAGGKLIRIQKLLTVTFRVLLVLGLAAGGGLSIETFGAASGNLSLIGPTALTAGVCSTAYTVSSNQKAGQTGTAITLSGGGSGSFFTDSACGNSAASVLIPYGAKSAAFYFRDSVAQSLALNASASGYKSASLSIVVNPAPVPPTVTITSTPLNPTNNVNATFSFAGSGSSGETVSFLCQLDGGTQSVCTSPNAYSGLAQGNHSFRVVAVNSAGSQSTAASYAWTINTTPPSAQITSTPLNPTNDINASFSFTGSDPAGETISFFCQLDGGTQSVCTSPNAYSGLAQGNHSFGVVAVNSAGSQSTAASYAWTINTTPPSAQITSTPLNPTNVINASFSFTGSDPAGETVSFLCQLDGGTQSVCTSPNAYSGLAQGNHSFGVVAVNSAGSQSTAASYAWTINTTPPSAQITSTPLNPTNVLNASFSFTASDPPCETISFFCQLDGGTQSVCTPPNAYSGLAQGNHSFRVVAVNSAGSQSTAASYAWTINTM